MLGANIRVLSGTVLLNYAPLVLEEEVGMWENYTRENMNSFFESIAAEEELREIHEARFNKSSRLLQQELAVSDRIITLSGRPENRSYHLPIWQQSPAVPFPLLNFDLLSHPTGQNAYEESLRTGKAVLDFADNLNKESYGTTGQYIQMVLSASQYRDVVDTFLGDPSS